MAAKMEQISASATNPLLNIDKNGCVLYSNEAGKPLLNEWDIEVGEKLPSYIEDLVQTVISKNSPEKTGVNVGNKVYLVVFHPVPGQELVTISGFDISYQKETEVNLRKDREQSQLQAEELNVANEELRIQTDELNKVNDELNKVNELLNEREITFRTLTENSPDLIARFDRKNHCLYANPAIMKFHDIPFIATFYGLSVSEFARKNNLVLQIDPKMVKISEKQRTNVFTTGKPEAMEFYYTSPQGKEYYFDTKIVPEFVNGEVTSILVISRDITERKKADEALKYIEIARKKEIHHRIKNNLQVISSLLDLQAEKFNGQKNIEDSQVMEAFRESQDRVISMALIHEELHKGEQIDTLNISTYIEELSNNLLLTYRVGNNGIILNIDINDNIFFDMDTSVPLGIIINELVSNSLKHAFVGRYKGEIRIKLSGGRKTGEYMGSIAESKNEGRKSTTFTLSISDNGVGIPEDLDIENLDSLGLQLVTTLVEQLDGELELKRNNGTQFIIRFTVPENRFQYQ